MEGDRIRQAAAPLPIVRFHGLVLHHRCMEVYGSADFLVATCDPFIPNYRFSSLHKLFEALRPGKPILVVEGTGMTAGSKPRNWGAWCLMETRVAWRPPRRT